MVDITYGNPTFASGYENMKEMLLLGEAVSAGMNLYQKTTDGKWYMAINTSAAAVQATRFAMSAGTAGTWIVGAKPGAKITATGTTKVPYFVSSTAGGTEALAAMSTSDYICYVGHGVTGGILLAYQYVLGEQVP